MSPDRLTYMRTNSDCVKATFSTYLSIPYEEFPNIDPNTWAEDIEPFLLDRGYGLLNVKLLPDSPKPRGICVGSIESTNPGSQHCVIVSDGEIVFDPERKSGVPCQTEILEYTFVYPLDPGKK